MRNKKNSCFGFTLIESLIVLVIIVLLAYIAFPNIKRAYISLNEKSIRTALRAFSAASDAFRNAQAPPQYAESIAGLIKPPSGLSYLDSSWKVSSKHGFNLVYAGGGKDHPNTYSLAAKPSVPGQTGRNSYCVDQRGILVSSLDTEKPLSGSAEGCDGGTVVTA